jgi:hypothetical protein
LSKNFCENVLHYFNNFVQLRASDIGLHVFQIALSCSGHYSVGEMKCELPELPRIR